MKVTAFWQQQNTFLPFCFILDSSTVLSLTSVKCDPIATPFKLTFLCAYPQFGFTEWLIWMRKYLQVHLARHEIFHSFWKLVKRQLLPHTVLSIPQRTALYFQNRILGCCFLSSVTPLAFWPDVIWPALRQTYLWVLGSGCISQFGTAIIKAKNICWVLTMYQE